ncbi:MAG: putative baseplate assembly protein [bacterium]|nr:putative baseplate assembly protein [bacterium]
MSSPWWTRDDFLAHGSQMVPDSVPGTVLPELVDPVAAPLLRQLRERVESFTPEWTHLRPEDAGVALVKLFGTQLQPLLERLNRLPEKALVEFLRAAGIEALPGTAARALLEFEVSDGATQSVAIPNGFQVGAPPADDSDGIVVFETERTLYAAPGKVSAVFVQEGNGVLQIDEFEGGRPFAPFGDRPIAGRAMLVGIQANSAPGPFLALGCGVAVPPGSPPPAAAGGLFPMPVANPPLLRWEVLDGASFEPAEVVADESFNLQRSGVVELRVPRRWRAGRPLGVETEEELFWLRIRIVHGSFEEVPKLEFVRANVVRAVAAETIRNEVLEHIPGSDDSLRLARTPVLPGSLVLTVFEGPPSGDIFDFDESLGLDDVPQTSSARGTTWSEVADLSIWGPNDRVFELDQTTGEVRFGDGVHGRALPPGFRHVQAPSYRVGGGARGAVDAETISTLIRSVPFVVGVSNPLPASGGSDGESDTAAVVRGPQEIRARGRAVTEVDYELMALRAPGADVARAHAVSGLHPSFEGTAIPGVVGVFVVPKYRDQGPPTPTEEDLRSVAEYLSSNVAAAGVEVVAAAPRYHRVRAEVAIVIADPNADVGATVRQVLDELDTYFDPLTGGDHEDGWPFGGAVRFMPLLRRILAHVEAVSAVPRLNLVVDGVRAPACSDPEISEHGLLWPESHEVIPEAEEATS